MPTSITYSIKLLPQPVNTTPLHRRPQRTQKHQDKLSVYLSHSHGHSLQFQDHAEFDFHGLYLRDVISGKNPNRALLVDLNASIGWGSTSVVNWTIYDGIGQDAQLVGRARGLQVDDVGWHNSLTLAFEGGRFKGSTLQLMGPSASVEQGGEWSIAGGTGNLVMARGVIKAKLREAVEDGDIWELTFHGFCSMQSLPMLTRAGPWGGAGDYTTYKDESEEPWRIQSMTIVEDEGTIVMFECTHVDLSGKRRSTGPWGPRNGDGIVNKVELRPREILRSVSGTYVGHNEETVIESLTFVTNEEEYGPYGRTTGTPFNYDVPEDQSIVGFFGRHGAKLIAIGVCTV